ncbi:TetR family transcriptional regulator [Nocardia sp. NPDC127526]|uniref:TetR family transcriptional regulator n=1 Tax=Nocardia sp. NPDC127526 TaxID=3345393 RepID=UPI00364427FE
MAEQRRPRADAVRNREAILASARELVITRGPKVGMDEIAAAAGVAVGTLYRHFPNKKDLIDAIVGELAAVIAGSLDAALARVEEGETSAIDEIIALLRGVMIDMRQERLLRVAVTGLADDSLEAIRERGRVAVGRLVDRAHRDGALYPDVTVDDVILLLATSPGDTATDGQRQRWIMLARRAIAAQAKVGG